MKTQRKLLTVFALGLGFFLPTQASINWRSTQGTAVQGECILQNSQVRVMVHSNYLDVEEEAEIGTTGALWGTAKGNSIEIFGNFNLEPGSTIVGMLLWNGQEILKAKLKDKTVADAQYEQVVDRNTTPVTPPRDPAIIEYQGNGQYGIKIFPVQLGQARKIRLRYYVPISIGENGIVNNLTTVFAPQVSSIDGQIRLELNKSGEGTYHIIQDGKKQGLNFPSTRLIKAGTSISIAPATSQNALATLTSFNDGAFKGNYLNYASQIPDELAKAPGLKMEIVCLWKWFDPKTFASSYQYDVYSDVYTNLTEYGYKSMQQASAIKGLMDALPVNNVSMSLIHDNGKDIAKVYPLSRPGSSTWLNAKGYLTQIDESYVKDFASQMMDENEIPRPNSDAERILSAKAAWKTNVKLVASQFSAEKGTLRHILFATCGPTPNARMDASMENVLDSLMGDKSYSVAALGIGDYWSNQGYVADNEMSRNVRWPGLNVGSLEAKHPINGNPLQLGWTKFPSSPEVSVVVSFKSNNKAIDLPVHCSSNFGLQCEPVYFNGKSDYGWDESMEWKLFGADGSVLTSYNQKPKIIKAVGDTTQAILWAGSNMPYAEQPEKWLGLKYGFVDGSMSLLALEKDKLSLAQRTEYAKSGVPLPGKKDIIPADTNVIYTNSGNGGKPNVSAIVESLAHAKSIQAKIQNGKLRINLSQLAGLGNLSNIRVTLTMPDGRIIKEVSVANMVSGLELDTPNLKPGVYFIRIQAKGFSGIYRIMAN